MDGSSLRFKTFRRVTNISGLFSTNPTCDWRRISAAFITSNNVVNNEHQFNYAYNIEFISTGEAAEISEDGDGQLSGKGLQTDNHFPSETFI